RWCASTWRGARSISPSSTCCGGRRRGRERAARRGRRAPGGGAGRPSGPADGGRCAIRHVGGQGGPRLQYACNRAHLGETDPCKRRETSKGAVQPGTKEDECRKSAASP